MRVKIRVIAGMVAIAASFGCGGASEQSRSVSGAILEKPGCESNRDRLWGELYRQIELHDALPEFRAVDGEIRSLARTDEQGIAASDLYRVIMESVEGLEKGEALQTLAEMELGDRTDPMKEVRQAKLESAIQGLRRSSAAADEDCDDTGSGTGHGAPDEVPLFESWRRSVHPALFGAYKTFSVAYQSCNAISVPTVNSGTRSVQGIRVVGTHSNGVGKKREVSNAALVFDTNPYYSGRVSAANGCFSDTKNPLIYDYGGKPYASSSLGTLDLFRNSGSGTQALGIDCSGFVASSILVSGLRLKAGVSNKAAQAGGVNSAMFANPAGNGLSCLAPVQSTPSQSLQPGDVVANGGHVFLIDAVGKDPLGIASARTASDCENVSYERFDFTLIQSSPSKGGIGLNRHRASDYLAGTSSFRNGLEAYAKSFCRVRLGLESPRTLANRSLAVVSRHKRTKECLDRPIQLVGSSCMKGCSTAHGQVSRLAGTDPLQFTR